METLEDTYKLLISQETVVNLNNDEALDRISHLIDLSFDLQKVKGLKHALKLSESLEKRKLSDEQFVLLHYFLGNAWDSIRRLQRGDSEKSWEWEQKEIEKGVIHYRKALRGSNSRDFPKIRECQILTNLGNLMDNIGRFVEAIDYWDRVLDINPAFGMALGNKGYALFYYAKALYDDSHVKIFLKYAYQYLISALKLQLEGNAEDAFNMIRMQIESKLSKEFLHKEIEMHSFSLGNSEQEIQYRQWCLNNRLFLNPINDIGPYPFGARDVLTTPDIVVSIDEGPYYPGFFNQMKQEYVSARYLYYEGINSEKVHFSDRDVLLFNTLDYPTYSLSVEKVKNAFRTNYSLLDKIAYFMNGYLNLSIPKKKVSFRSLWYMSQQRDKGIRKDFQQRENWPLRGLFWLSKDLLEDKDDFRDSIAPDAQELSKIRNHLEHKYLKLHDEDWSGPLSNKNNEFSGITDTLAHSLYRRDFEAKTLKLIKMARAALIYLSLAIHSEERQRANEKSSNKFIMKMPLDIWEDEWKR